MYSPDNIWEARQLLLTTFPRFLGPTVVQTLEGNVVSRWEAHNLEGEPFLSYFKGMMNSTRPPPTPTPPPHQCSPVLIDTEPVLRIPPSRTTGVLESLYQVCELQATGAIAKAITFPRSEVQFTRRSSRAARLFNLAQHNDLLWGEDRRAQMCKRLMQ